MNLQKAAEDIAKAIFLTHGNIAAVNGENDTVIYRIDEKELAGLVQRQLAFTQEHS